MHGREPPVLHVQHAPVNIAVVFSGDDSLVYVSCVNMYSMKPRLVLTELGCKGVWDSIACWERAEIGEIVTIPCPRVLKTVFGRNGRLFIYLFTNMN